MARANRGLLTGNSLTKALVTLEADEGPDVAKNTAENWQDMLEEMMEVAGNKDEQAAIRLLLARVRVYLKSRIIIMPY